AAVRLLGKFGARVAVADQKPLAELTAALEGLRAGDLEVHGSGAYESALRGAELVVVSPGVPLTLEPLRRARAAGVRVIGELELAAVPHRQAHCGDGDEREEHDGNLDRRGAAAGGLRAVRRRQPRDAAGGGRLCRLTRQAMGFCGGRSVQLSTGDDRDLPPLDRSDPERDARSSGPLYLHG